MVSLEFFSGFSKKPNSTKQPLGSGTTVSAVFKENTSVLNPHFIVKSYNLAYNYVKWGSRYYFVDDIIMLSDNMAEYVCSSDVLATFKSEIISSSQYVTRAAGAYNPYVVDFMYPALQDTDLSNILLSGLATDQAGLYVLGVAGPDGSNAVTYYALAAASMASLMAGFFNVNLLNAADISLELQKELFNPFQYIVSCYWYPISKYDLVGTLDTVKFGWYDSGVNAGRLDESQRIYSWEDTFTPPRHPQAATRGAYLNGSPYTRYTLNCFSFGSIPLDPSPFVDGDAGAIEVDVDVFTGVAQMYVACRGGRLFTATSQIGVPVQINQNTANVIGGALSFAGAIGSALSGNVLGTASGVASAIESAMPQMQSQGANGSKVAFLQTPNIVAEFRNISDEDNAQIGRPLCAVRTISSLSGYIRCEEADLDVPASPIEKEMIMGFMNGGFYNE